MNQDERPPVQPPSRRRWVVGLILALALAAAAYFFKQPARQRELGAGPNPKAMSGKPADPVIPVAVELAVLGDVPVYLGGLGTVTPLHTVTVRSRVDGELIRVAFTEGQMVKQGDLLAEIDPRPFKIQLQQAEGQLARDLALLENAEADLVRYQTLLAQDSIGAQQTVTQEALVKQYRGTVEMDRSQVNNAKLQLTYAQVTAPVSGRVGLRVVDRGNIVRANDTNGLAVITQIEPIAAVFTLAEDVLPAVMKRWRSGEEIIVEAYDREGKEKLAEGKLLAVDNQIDPATGTIKLKAQFPNGQNTLFSNQFINIKMKLDLLRSTVLIPTAAIQQGVNGAFVYGVKDDKTVVMRPIKLGPIEKDRAAVLDGLTANEAVVVDGADKLREGSKVEVIQREPKPVEQATKKPTTQVAKPNKPGRGTRP